MEIPPPHDDPWNSNPVIKMHATMEALRALDGAGNRHSLTLQGELLEVKKVRHRKTESKVGKRAKITGFSAKSRWNLLKKTMRWDWDKIGPSVFVTLTYPDRRARPTMKDRNKNRYLWHRMLEAWQGRHTPVLWRVEYAERRSGELVGETVPHWHMLVFGVPYIPHELVRSWWGSVIGFEGYVRTDVRAVKGPLGAAKYLSKYIAKDVCTNSLVRATYHNIKGRHWGILREKEIPCHRRIHIAKLSDAERAFIYEIAAERLAGVDDRSQDSFTSFGQFTADILKNLERNGIDIIGDDG